MNHLHKQKLKYDFFVAITITILLGYSAYSLPQLIVLKKWNATNVEVWAGMAMGAFAMFLYYKIQRFFDVKFDGWIDQSKYYRKGIAGEKMVYDKLKECLSSNAQIIPSVVVGKYGDTDLVVVCNKGMIVIEVKNWSDEILIKNGKLWRKKFGGKQWQLVEKDPFFQARSQARDIDEMLKSNNCYVKPSIPIVVFLNKVKWEGKPQALVAYADDLDKTLNYIQDASDYYKDDIIEIIAKKIREYSTV